MVSRITFIFPWKPITRRSGSRLAQFRFAPPESCIHHIHGNMSHQEHIKNQVFCRIFIILFLLPGAIRSHLAAQPADRVVKQEIEAGNILGAVLMAGTPDTVLFHRAYGERDTGKPMVKNCIFDISSVTKPTMTGTSLAILLSRDKLALDDLLSQHLPAFTGPGSGEVTIRQTATHTSGINNRKILAKTHKGERLIRAIMEYDTSWAPGTKYQYSCLNFIRLSEMIARVTGMPFEKFCQQDIFEPLELNDTRFGPVTGPDLLRRTVRTTAPPGQIQDPNARKSGRPVGNAGLFTTAADLSRIAVLWLQEGEINGQRIFDEAVCDTMIRRNTPLAPRGIAWALNDHSFCPPELSPRTYYHTGYNGHALCIDPETKTFYIVLTVWKHPAIKASYKEGRKARSRILSALARSIGQGESVTGPPLSPEKSGKKPLSSLHRGVSPGNNAARGSERPGTPDRTRTGKPGGCE